MSVLRILIVLFIGTANAEIFTWTDEAGRTHYSDRAPDQAGVQVIELASPDPNSKPLSEEAKAWKQNALKVNLDSARSRDARSSYSSNPVRKHADCERAMERLRYYEYGWDKKRTRGYKQSERNVFMDKIQYYRAEVARIC